MTRLSRGYIGVLIVLLALLVLLGSCTTPGAGSKERLHYSAPVILPGTTPVMNTPGFWIGLHPDPDRVVIPSDEIAAFNESIRSRTGMVRDVSVFPDTVVAKRVVGAASGSLQFVRARSYFRRDGRRIDADFLREIQARMNLSRVPPVAAVRFGLVTSCTSQRILPTDEQLFSSMKSTDIDRLQNSAYDVGTPLAILHSSSDGAWLYAVTPLSEGWMKAGKVGLCTREQLMHYLGAEPFVVATGAKADLFLDQKLLAYHGYVRMGCRFPCRETQDPGVIEVLLPFRNDDGGCELRGGYVAASQVSRGYLPYTPRNLITQAFRLLHSPYGWGDMHGEQDCSRFVQMVFSTVGIGFPRNSLQQSKVGRLVTGVSNGSGVEERVQALSDRSLGGKSILHMNGHIMLFLGSVDGAPYAIHDMRGYSEPDGDRERFRLVNRVVVSSLDLGRGTRTGSYLGRLLTVRAVESAGSTRELASP